MGSDIDHAVGVPDAFNAALSSPMKENNVPQCQIAKASQIASSTVHNIIKIFKETGEISVCKGQG